MSHDFLSNDQISCQETIEVLGHLDERVRDIVEFVSPAEYVLKIGDHVDEKILKELAS